MSLKDKASSFEINPEQLQSTKRILVDLLTRPGRMGTGFSGDLPVYNGLPLELYVDDFSTFYIETLGDLREKFSSVFDMPSKQFFDGIKKTPVVVGSRRDLFSRLITRPYPGDPNAPVIITRWYNGFEGRAFLQMSIAHLEDNGMKYVHKVRVFRRGSLGPVYLPTQEQTLTNTQEESYWGMVFVAARVGIQNYKYPYSAVYESSKRYGGIVIARNENAEEGGSLGNHAEHLAMVATNGTGMKINPEFGPRLFSLVFPCEACCFMAREQGGTAKPITEIHYLLEQPDQADILERLFNERKDGKYGPPPAVICDFKFRERALEVFRQVNNHYSGLFPGQFNDTIDANS